jgi:phage terminase small subunit
MAKTGRKPYETYDVTAYGSVPRLRPPESLGEQERAVFLDLVTSTDPRQFRESDLPLLCRYAELVVLAEQAAGELAADGVVIADSKGTRIISPWFQVHASAVRSLAMVATRLKLSPSARAPKAPKTTPRPVSYYEIAALEVSRDRDSESEDGAGRA